MKELPLFKVHVPQSALTYIKSVFDSGFINEGREVSSLTEILSNYLAANVCLTNSCTSAITMALVLAGVGHDNEVISTPMTCAATNTPIVNLGAKIVWADIDPNTGMLDPSDVSKKITKKTKAVVVVAWGGTPPNLQRLSYICQANNIKLILDAAHAFDAWYGTKRIHEWVDYCCYSFQAIKHFTTGDGGALICKSKEDHQRAKAMKWFGIDRDSSKDVNGNWKGKQWDVDIVEAGYKFNMNNVAAAIGISQFETLSPRISIHRENAKLYNEFFESVCFPVKPLHFPTKFCTSSYWIYTVLVEQQSKYTRDQLIEKLNSLGIKAGIVHTPNDELTCFRHFSTNLPGVREFASKQFSIPCGWWIEKKDVEYITQSFVDLFR